MKPATLPRSPAKWGIGGLLKTAPFGPLFTSSVTGWLCAGIQEKNLALRPHQYRLAAQEPAS
jgi:hypothetical protein